MQIDAPEERLSKYELIRLLGSGGMGEVYLARDTVLQRQVAIKFVSAERLSDPAANARLLREARAAATLDHPGICPVYDVHTDALGRTCIVMQYVQGETLSERLAKGPMDPAEALELAAAVAETLAAAHARGIVHRDLKPQNIMVTPEGRPKLLDFGIAQTELSPEAVAQIATHTATSDWPTGTIIGTPAYMSPEQVLCKPIDGRSDLFSLGVVLFECLTGRAAFQAATDVDTWARVVYVTLPAPSSINPRVTRPIDAAVARLVAKEPGDRFASAAEAARALRPPATRPAPPSSPRRSALLASLCVAVIALGGYGGWRVLRPRGLPPAPAEARRWYDQGTEHIRNGAYFSAQQALSEAARIYPEYAVAYARLAEAASELDEENNAAAALLQAASLAGDPPRLPAEDALRFTAIRALVLRRIPEAIAAYARITDTAPRDRGAWLDLGRVQQAAGLRGEARVAYAHALQIDTGYAAAHLRLGALAAEEVRREEALREFAEAERLYVAASDVEGETEALLRRGAFLSANGDVKAARQAADAAARLAAGTKSPSQAVRAQLLSSLVAIAEGNFAQAETQAREAVDTALQKGLDTVAADGLIDLANAQLQAGNYPAGQQRVQQAIDLARRRGAQQIAARGTVLLGSVFLQRGQFEDARNVIGGVRPFLEQGQFRRLQLVGLSILGRADEYLGDYAAAEKISSEVLAVAEALEDDSEISVALDNLAGVADARGLLPQALKFRERREVITRRLRATTWLAYDVVNHADVLIRLGRFTAAEPLLREADEGAAAGIQAFAGRQRRVLLLRAMAANMQRRFAEGESRARAALAASAGQRDFTAQLAYAVTAYARAAQRRPTGPLDPVAPGSVGSPASVLELRYWRACAALAGGRAQAALEEVSGALAILNRAPSFEVEWRLAAVGAIAARSQRDPAQADALAARARAALDRIHNEWRGDAAEYDRRPDIVELKRATGVP